MKKIVVFVVLISGGVTGGVISAMILTKFLQHIGEYNNTISISSLILLGLLIGISIVCIYLIINYFRKLIEIKSWKISFGYLILTFLFLVSIFFGLYFLGEINFFAWLLLTLSFSLWIYMGFSIGSAFVKKSIINNFLNTFSGCVGGIISGIFVSLACLLRINFSIDEGYFLLVTFLLSLIGAIIGATISIAANIYQIISKDSDIFVESIASNKTKVISILLVFVLLFSVTAYNYWGAMGLNESKALDTSNEEPFTFYSLADKGSMSNISSYTKKDLISFLKSKPNKTIDIFAVLYLLTEDEKWANKFKELLLDDARNSKFIGVSGSVKAWQYKAMIHAYYYLLLTEKYPDLFSNSEKDLILDWFKDINEQTFKAGWVDYIYGFLFKKMPEGPYVNQEIGTGLLSVLSEVLKEKYPDLAKKDIEYINNHGVGWKGNFRNPDDGIVYHQHIWIKNAYMMAKYGGQNEYLISNNSRNSFEWILLQWPPNGMSPAYNVLGDNTPFDIMILGANLFNDGRYLWLAERMLSNEIKNINRTIDYLVGLSYWNDNLVPVEPTVGSCYIEGTTGIAKRPGPLKPDKIVFRNGWDNNSLYALLNLRFSGWHSYKATNCFVNIMYGEPFIVEKLEVKQHSWLPKGKADHRDKKILREELNGFQIEKTGLEKIIYEITGFGSPWAQDPSWFAEVVAFNSAPIADYGITKLSDWHGWEHQRASVLVKDKNNPFLAVFDYAKGDAPRKVGITWHLKGDAEFSSDKIELTQDNYTLAVHYPHSNNWYQMKIVNSSELYPPAGDIHGPDLDFWMISEDKSKVGFITLFYPERRNNNCKVEKIDVLNNKDQVAYPKAVGTKFITPDQIYIIGARFESGEFIYEGIKTDAKAFVLQKDSNLWTISFEDASLFSIKSDKSPIFIGIDGKSLIENIDWEYDNKVIVVETHKVSGELKIKFEL